MVLKRHKLFYLSERHDPHLDIISTMVEPFETNRINYKSDTTPYIFSNALPSVCM